MEATEITVTKEVEVATGRDEPHLIRWVFTADNLRADLVIVQNGLGFENETQRNHRWELNGTDYGSLYSAGKAQARKGEQEMSDLLLAMAPFFIGDSLENAVA